MYSVVFLQSCCIFNASQTIAGSLSKKTLTIEEKMKLIDTNKKARQSCRQLADHFRTGCQNY